MFQIITSLLIIGAVFFIYVLDGDKSKIPFLNKKSPIKNDNKGTGKEGVNHSKLKSSQKRLPFKSIKSSGAPTDKSLIIRNDTTYIGIIEVYGVNYNLLSVSEKLLLEEAFQMVLNGIDYPIQLFIQSRKMDIDNYNNIYEERIEELRELEKKEVAKLNFLNNQDIRNEIEIKDTERNIKRITNQIEYGVNVIKFINNIAYNSDILDKKYYMCVSYNYDRGLFSHEQTEHEIFVTAFNTISNRLNSLLTGLGRGGIEGKVLNGLELAELIYTAFNKHDASEYKIATAINTGFANYVITSRPVEHKMYEHEEFKLIELAKKIAN